MANELLDFVMSLVRDPAAAARYAADPSAAIADAHLTNVTSADVNHLIPMVSDSLSLAAPAFGGHGTGDGNVWTSGAATAAFDAFTPHLPDQVVAAVHDMPGVIDTAAVSAPDVGSTVGDLDPGHGLPPVDDVAQFSDVVDDHPAAAADGLGIDDPGVWDHGVADPQHDHPGFDLFS